MSLRELIYFSAASALGLFTFVFFHFSANPRLKQRLWTTVHILGGAVFIAFMLGRELGAVGTFFTVLGTLAVVYLSLTNSRFCDDCSALIFGPERPEWRGNCPSCGVRLPWSEFYPGPESPPYAGSNGVHPSAARPGASPPQPSASPSPSPSPSPSAEAPLPKGTRAAAEIDRAFETEGEHHATAPDASPPSVPPKNPVRD